MSRVIRIAKTLRRHWKKSTFAFSLLAYGVTYGIEKYQTFQILRAYCEEAKKYGEMTQHSLAKSRHVTVILNPEANDRKAKINYEKYAAPILHLAGMKVSLIQTENAGQATDLMEIMDNTDAVIIAGGDGTLHEAITGLFRRKEFQDNVTTKMPLGVFPVGKTNTVAKVLFSDKSSNKAEWLAESAISVIRRSTDTLDVLKIKTEEDKPYYTLTGLELGAFPNMEANINKYWYLGALKSKFAYLKNSFEKGVSFKDVPIEYAPPCEGCSQCFVQHKIPEDETTTKRWWSAFIPKAKMNDEPTSKDYSKIKNEECGILQTLNNSNFSTLLISTGLKYFHSLDKSPDAFKLTLFPDDLPAGKYIRTGLDYHIGRSLEESNEKREVRSRELKFSCEDTSDKGYYIDNERREASNFHVTFLKKRLVVYR